MSVGAALTGPPATFEAWADELARLLRTAEVTVPVDSVLTFVAALDEVGAFGRQAVHDAALLTLIRRPEDHAPFDASFDRWWDGRTAPFSPGDDTAEAEVTVDTDEDLGAGDEHGDDDPVPALRFSNIERLRRADLADCTEDELDELHRLISLISLRPADRASRRRRPRPNGDRVDLRRTMRAATSTGGEVMRWRHTSPRRRPRRVVLLVDVSGSMEPYARALLRFAHAAVSARGRMGVAVEAFALGTRLTRLTRELTERDPDAALSLVAGVTADYSGGTRLGEALDEFVQRWGAPGMARGADVVILSDGWDRGDPDVLDAAMSRLGRLAHRVVWVNPLRASPGYAPLARGMATALPHLDRFIDGHSVASLEDLAELLGGNEPIGR
ncbi:MAG: VWA domain-containing protein [Microthrixaceae bacterium]